MRRIVRVHAGNRGAKAVSKKPSTQTYSVSAFVRDAGGGVFESYALPNGKTANILDRRVYEAALAKTDARVRRTLAAIRESGGNLAVKE
jgi:hypothetical protein